MRTLALFPTLALRQVQVRLLPPQWRAQQTVLVPVPVPVPVLVLVLVSTSLTSPRAIALPTRHSVTA